jgi:hypothetical protein
MKYLVHLLVCDTKRIHHKFFKSRTIMLQDKALNDPSVFT